MSGRGSRFHLGKVAGRYILIPWDCAIFEKWGGYFNCIWLHIIVQITMWGNSAPSKINMALIAQTSIDTGKCSIAKKSHRFFLLVSLPFGRPIEAEWFGNANMISDVEIKLAISLSYSNDIRFNNPSNIRDKTPSAKYLNPSAYAVSIIWQIPNIEPTDGR